MPVDLTLFETSTAYMRPKSGLPAVVRQDGALAATLVNTLSARRKSLTSYADLLGWGAQTGSLGADESEGLARVAAERPADAAAAFGRMQELLACLERILGSLANLKMPDDADVEALNAEVARASRRLTRAPGGGYRWAWGERRGEILDRPLWPVVLSAGEILSSVYYRYVRRCAGRDCDLLFVDRSPGKQRKYCSRTRGCGNQAKARRYYHTTMKHVLAEGERQRRELSFEERFGEVRKKDEEDGEDGEDD